MGNSGCSSPGKGSCDRVTVPNLLCVLGVCFHNPRSSDTDHRIFNVRTDTNACECPRGVFGHRKRVCTENWLVEKTLAAPENRTCGGGVPVRCSTNWATSRTRFLTYLASSPSHSLQFVVLVICNVSLACKAMAACVNVLFCAITRPEVTARWSELSMPRSVQRTHTGTAQNSVIPNKSRPGCKLVKFRLKSNQWDILACSWPLSVRLRLDQFFVHSLPHDFHRWVS